MFITSDSITPCSSGPHIVFIFRLFSDLFFLETKFLSQFIYFQTSVLKQGLVLFSPTAKITKAKKFLIWKSLLLY